MDNHLKKYDTDGNIFSFSELFSARYVAQIEIAFEDDFLLVIATLDSVRYFPVILGPPSGLKKIMEKIVAQFGQSLLILPLNIKEINNFKQHCLQDFDFLSIKRVRNMDDYIYRVEDLINLPGKKFHSKRNHISKFTRTYPNWRYKSLEKSDIDECIEFYQKWYDDKIQKIERDTVSYFNIEIDKEITINFLKDLIKEYSKFQIKGGIIYVEQNMVAFSLGEGITEEVATIYFEKADINYPGSYAVINNETAKNEWSNFKYLNKQDDGGVPYLRKSKLSYRPFKMLEAYALVSNKLDFDINSSVWSYFVLDNCDLI